ncbi:MAG: hypothetical protein ACW98F_18240 [Candidatus Hodarchaeales archaeon]|jgi:hypothetical protein
MKAYNRFRTPILIVILVVGLPILVFWSMIILIPMFTADVGGPMNYYLKITELTNTGIPIKNPVNLTETDVLNVPVLYSLLEKILSDPSRTSASQYLSKEENEPLKALFESKEAPLTVSRQFYYNNTLFEILYNESIA